MEILVAAIFPIISSLIIALIICFYIPPFMMVLDEKPLKSSMMQNYIIAGISFFIFPPLAIIIGMIYKPTQYRKIFSFMCYIILAIVIFALLPFLIQAILVTLNYQQ